MSLSIMLRALGLFAAVALAHGSVGAAPDTHCNLAACPAGSKVKSYARPDDAYFACPTKELADYTNFALGAVTVVYTMTGQMPNISPVTGEPEFAGATGAAMAAKRRAAMARTLDEAAAKCTKGANGRAYLVANDSDQGMLWVQDAKSKVMSWAPKSHFDLIR